MTKLIKTSALVTLIATAVFQACIWYFGKSDLAHFTSALIIFTSVALVGNFVAIYFNRSLALAIASTVTVLAATLVLEQRLPQAWLLIFLCVLAISMRGLIYAIKHQITLIQVLTVVFTQSVINILLFGWLSK